MPKVKDKERILKAAKEKQLVIYKGVPIRLSADFSTKTSQARKDWQEIFRVIKTKDLQTKLLYPKTIIQNQKINKELPRQEKAKRVHHYKKCSGDFFKKKKKNKNNKITTTTYLSIITININVVNASIKIHRIAER